MTGASRASGPSILRLVSWWKARSYRCCRTWNPHFVYSDSDGVIRCSNSHRPVANGDGSAT